EGFCHVAFFGTDDAHLWTEQFYRCQGGGTLRCWEVATGREKLLPKSICGPPAHFSVWDILPDDRLVCQDCLNRDEKEWRLRFVDVNTGQEWCHIQATEPSQTGGGESSSRFAVCPSGDGRKLAAYSARASEPHIDIWDIPRRRREATLKSDTPLALSN